MQTLHVGGGTTRGAMSIFPIWGEFAQVQPHIAVSGAVQVVEQEGAATVGSLVVQNHNSLPVLVFEGQVLEGGWQNRMVAKSQVLAARSSSLVDVVCVEEGRWGGGRDHTASGRRASARVRSGLRTDRDRQSTVWDRVREYEGSLGATATGSFTDHADRLDDRIGHLTGGARALPGQIGLLVAVSGQPVFAELFADHDTLVCEFDSIIRAAGMDALGRADVKTPARRARRFVERASQVRVEEKGPAGLGRTLAGADQYAQISGVSWDGADAHVVLTNPRHELNLVSA